LKKEVEDVSFLADELIRGGFKVRLLQLEEIDLEDVFLGITKGVVS
jgi:hypothetical protein